MEISVEDVLQRFGAMALERDLLKEENDRLRNRIAALEAVAAATEITVTPQGE